MAENSHRHAGGENETVDSKTDIVRLNGKTPHGTNLSPHSERGCRYSLADLVGLVLFRDVSSTWDWRILGRGSDARTKTENNVESGTCIFQSQ